MRLTNHLIHNAVSARTTLVEVSNAPFRSRAGHRGIPPHSRERFLLLGCVWAPGGVRYFAYELFEDVFERDHALGLAVLVDEPGKV